MARTELLGSESTPREEALAILSQLTPSQVITLVSYIRQSPTDVYADYARMRARHCTMPPMLALIEGLEPMDALDLANFAVAVMVDQLQAAWPEARYVDILVHTTGVGKDFAEKTVRNNIYTEDSNFGSFYYLVARNAGQVPLIGPLSTGIVGVGTEAIKRLFNLFSRTGPTPDALFEWLRGGRQMREMRVRLGLVTKQADFSAPPSLPEKSEVDSAVLAQQIASAVSQALAAHAGTRVATRLTAAVAAPALLEEGAATIPMLAAALGDPFEDAEAAERKMELDAIAQLATLARRMKPTKYHRFSDDHPEQGGFMDIAKRAMKMALPAVAGMVPGGSTALAIADAAKKMRASRPPEPPSDVGIRALETAHGSNKLSTSTGDLDPAKVGATLVAAWTAK